MSASDDDGLDDDGLKDPFPDDFDALRIGTAINADMNELLLGSEAFDMKCLTEEGLLSPGVGESTSHVWAGGTTQKSQEALGWSTSASMGLKSGIVDASASFYVQQTLNACRSSSKATIVGTNTYSNCVELKQHGTTREQYLKCATPPFQQAITKIYVAAKALESSVDPTTTPAFDALVDALTDFYDRFGTGFVYKLNLLTIGVFEGSLISNSDFTETTLDVGGGFSVSLVGIGAGAAAGYCKTQKTANAAVAFETRSYGRPVGCGSAIWAQDMADKLEMKGIDECIKPEVWSTPMHEKVNPPKVPDYSPKPPPSSEPTPSSVRDLPSSVPELPTIPAGALVSAIKEMQYRKLAEKYKTEGDRDKALQAELDDLKKRAKFTAEEINNQAATPLPPPSAPEPRLRVDVDAPPPAARAAAEKSGGENKLFGGYAPSGYFYKPWEAIFPELNGISKVCTTSQVVFGQSLAWFSMRGVFAQYLDYCAYYPDVVGRDWHIDVAANEFRLALNAVSKFLSESLKNRENRPDLTFLQRLEGKLNEELEGRHFRMHKHYQFWIKNYEWLKKVPFGVVAVVVEPQPAEHGEHDKQYYYYQENPYPHCPLRRVPRETGFTRTDCIWPEELLGGNAYRLYPIISTDYYGKPYFVWVGVPSRLTGDRDDAVLRFSGLLSFNEFPQTHPSYKPGDQIAKNDIFDETTLPMLIHQSADNAQVIANAENVFRPPLHPPNHLQERWDNRKAMYGMHLYPGFGEQNGFGSEVNLLKVARECAYKASQHGPVLPHKDDIDRDVWRLRDPDSARAAYFHDALFFWGPAGGPGWDLKDFERREIRLVPITYDAVRNVKRVKSGGRPMWMEPRTDELVKRVQELAT